MSTVNSVVDTHSIAQRSQTVAASSTARTAATDTHPTAEKTAIPMHRLESYQRWASVTQGQHKVSAAQVAEQGLKQVETLLKQLHKQAKASLSNDPARASQANQQAQHIQQQLTQLEISYFDKPLLDHQLNLVSSQRPAAKHQFVMRSIDLTSSKSRDEQIQVQANGESTTILLPGNSDSRSLQNRLAKGLAPLGIEVMATAAGTRFASDSEHWQQLQQGLLMTGQGQRLPAGEPRTIKLQEQLSWQDPREWQLGSNEELKQAIAKISKSLFKVDQQLGEIREAKQKMQQQLHKINRSQSHNVNVEQTLEQLHGLMQSTPFSLQVTSMMAQANVSRSHVSALLKS
ncbi:hypothetical protein FLM48_22310 [Shewanella sp. Scap07]|uniref:hypothetical protein n=1 Tax=Shewanella sp. Scap07 TaxID=2589987 RepID=UPI0015BB85B7|nr:hypothetical protein [Shewanella sp. Scap07]QLE87567.1 hypothetical protein FLM48_22310 [Shewanella sp. Scap07]